MGEAPDVLVLGAGGVVGRAWLAGVLAGLERATGRDLRECEAFVGTSAGAIVAAALAAGRRPEAAQAACDAPVGDGRARPFTEPPARERARARGARATIGALRPLAGVALRATAPVGALARAAMLARAPRGDQSMDELARRLDRLGYDFDGRLKVVCVERRTGRRIVFGDPGAPRTSVGRAVLASCAIPGVFPPVEIGGRQYVDGGVWSLTNLDVAPVRKGQRVLCLNPTGGPDLLSPSLAAALASWSRARLALEEQALRARGAAVLSAGPDREAADAIGPNLMDWRRADAGAEAGFRQGLRLAERL